MPILTEANPHRKRRPPVWVVILAVVVLPLSSVFAWSCYRTVRIGDGARCVVFGRINGFDWPSDWGGFWETDATSSFYNEPGDGWSGRAYKLPGGWKTGWYEVIWRWE